MKKDFRIESLEGRKVLITGGTGFIGSNLAHRCVELGAEVTLFDRTRDKIKNVEEIRDNIKIIEGDIRDGKKVENAVKGKDFIFHLGAQTSNTVSMEDPVTDLQINVQGTLNILESCRKSASNASIVFTGSVAEIGRITRIPVTEDMKAEPLSVYDANKLVCEKYLQIYHTLYGLRTVTLRLANIFGERQRLSGQSRGVLNQMIKRAIVGETITVYGDGKFLRDYNYISNLVDALLLAAQSKITGGKYYPIGTGRGISFKEMVTSVNETVKKIMGKSTEIKHVPFPEDVRKMDIGDVVIDFSRFNADTGWHPKIPFEEGLERTVKFYKEHLKEYLI